MGLFKGAFLLACIGLAHQAEPPKTYADMFPHKHLIPGKIPYPIPPIPGWGPDTHPWDAYIYPPMKPKNNELMNRRGKPTVQLTSNSPALSGSIITFTAKFKYPPCQKEDASGNLVWDDRCDDAMELEASADGQVHPRSPYNWTTWLDRVGFGKCRNPAKCNVFPDGKPLPRSNWRDKNYVYVWHTMGQYFQTNDDAFSTLTLNTSVIPVGAEVMEVLVYRKQEDRKYRPLSTDSVVFYVTDKIPLAVDISQKAAVHQPDNVFFRGEDVLFQVHLHDPSGYLRKAAAIDYVWDFRDGNQLVTHRPMTTHTYAVVGNVTVKLVVEAAFPVECPPATANSASTPPPSTEASTPPPTPVSTTTKTTQAMPSTASDAMTAGIPTTEILPSNATPGTDPSTPHWARSRRMPHGKECYSYVYGTFAGNISIIEPKQQLQSEANSRILDVMAARVTKTDVTFLVKCLGSIPTSACTIVSDATCSWVHSIVCDKVPPSAKCQVTLRRSFPQPGTYCVNITLEDSSSLTQTTTTVTVNKSQLGPESQTPDNSMVILTTSAVLLALFALIACVVYRRYRVYRPVTSPLAEDARSRGAFGGRVIRLREALFPSSEERHHLLTERRPM
ncbi:protein QNR-71 isoform X1 [Nerophis ophidion]|uniref:protein QNR-71 isoform X1 n=1 Tax=Nerophis ophidion TaxID=159077 RepID=UPI002AE0374D|nr:protein QNR-71 isoform X1 [Nerophis ophidion]